MLPAESARGKQPSHTHTHTFEHSFTCTHDMVWSGAADQGRKRFVLEAAVTFKTPTHQLLQLFMTL